MKAIIAILTAVIYCLLCSCSTVGLYTKKQAIEKFCKQGNAQLDTIIKIDTAIIDSGENFKFNLDYATLQAQYDSLKNITKIKDKQLDSMGYALLYSDSLFDLYYKPQGKQGTNFVLKPKERKIPATLQVPIKINLPCNCPPCPEPPKPTFWQKIVLYCKNALSLIGATILLILTIRYIISKLSK
jgi:hypothetical protein